MIYTVQVKRDYFNQYADYTFQDEYFNGSEKQFNTEEEAVQYFKSFEDWEQDFLMVESFPFWVPGVMPGDRIPHSVLPPAEMGTAHTWSYPWIWLQVGSHMIYQVVIAWFI